MRTVNVQINNVAKEDAVYVGTRDCISKARDQNEYFEEVFNKILEEDGPVTVKIEKGRGFCVRVYNIDLLPFDIQKVANESMIINVVRIEDKIYEPNPQSF